MLRLAGYAFQPASYLVGRLPPLSCEDWWREPKKSGCVSGDFGVSLARVARLLPGFAAAGDASRRIGGPMILSNYADPNALRTLAENAVVEAGPAPDPGTARAALVYELQLHKAELEIQNEALRDAQRELELSRERYEMLFEQAPVGYLMLDDDFRIRLSNGRACELLGGAPDRLRGTRFQAKLDPGEAIAFERYRREVERSERLVTAEFMFTIDDAQRELQLHAARTRLGGRQIYLALTEVTERNELARRLEHAERLRAVGQNASELAHDLNNLLYSALGQVETSLRTVTRGERAYDRLIKLRDVIQRCTRTTNQIATFARAETIRPSIVDVNAAIASRKPELSELLGPSVQLDLRLDASDGVVGMSSCDVEQILLSTLRNARHAMPGGGSLVIETRMREDVNDRTEPRRWLRWSISDTGDGMSEHVRRHALEAFFTTKSPGAGTGLGLSIVAGIVRRAGGTITIESAPGKGTTLVIDLPCAVGMTASG